MRNGATHHIIIPQYPSGNQTGQFAASYCHPEPEHSRPVLKKETKWAEAQGGKSTMCKFTIQTKDWNWTKNFSALPSPH